MRLRLVEASRGMIAAAFLMLGGTAVLLSVPEPNSVDVPRESFALFPRHLENWRSGAPEYLDTDIERVLGADDYHSVTLTRPSAAADVGLFMAWYDDQIHGGVHSPEICLPSAGREIAWLERTNVAEELGTPEPFVLNRAIIQKGEARTMVYYWFEQKGRRIAWDFAARFFLLRDGLTSGRTDGGMVRLTTMILPGESDAEAEARLMDVMEDLVPVLPQFVPEEVSGPRARTRRMPLQLVPSRGPIAGSAAHGPGPRRSLPLNAVRGT